MTTATRKPTEIRVYWDSQDRSNEGWAYNASDEDGLITSSGLDGIDDDDLCGAVDQACYELDVELTHDDFAIDRHGDGGNAIWSS